MLLEPLDLLERGDQERAGAQFVRLERVAQEGELVAEGAEEVGVGVDVGQHPEDGGHDVRDGCETDGHLEDAEGGVIEVVGSCDSCSALDELVGVFIEAGVVVCFERFRYAFLAAAGFPCYDRLEEADHHKTKVIFEVPRKLECVRVAKEEKIIDIPNFINEARNRIVRAVKGFSHSNGVSFAKESIQVRLLRNEIPRKDVEDPNIRFGEIRTDRKCAVHFRVDLGEVHRLFENIDDIRGSTEGVLDKCSSERIKREGFPFPQGKGNILGRFHYVYPRVEDFEGEDRVGSTTIQIRLYIDT